MQLIRPGGPKPEITGAAHRMIRAMQRRPTARNHTPAHRRSAVPLSSMKSIATSQALTKASAAAQAAATRGLSTSWTDPEVNVSAPTVSTTRTP